MDPTDVTYLDEGVFTFDELEEIKNHRAVMLPQLPSHLKEYLALYKGKVSYTKPYLA